MKGRVSTVSGPRRILMIFGLTLLILLLLGGGYIFFSPMLQRDKGEVVPGSADWMAELPDHLRLNEISLPGTHDSAATYVQMAFFAKCQTKSISAQLQAGFRYLDIRLAVEKDKLVLTHGSMRCKRGSQLFSANLYLEDVLEECRAFLREHPAETILFAVKQEDGEESIADFQKILHRYINTAPSVWLLTDHFPSLEEARGKIVLLRRYQDEGQWEEEAGIPLIWTDQGNTEEMESNTAAQAQPGQALSSHILYTLWVQDRYKYPAEEKWKAFTAGLHNASYDADTLALHFLSTRGSAALGRPYGFAKDLNKRLSMYEGLPDQCGWVIMDFGTAPLAAKIYDQNFNRP